MDFFENLRFVLKRSGYATLIAFIAGTIGVVISILTFIKGPENSTYSATENKMSQLKIKELGIQIQNLKDANDIFKDKILISNRLF